MRAISLILFLATAAVASVPGPISYQGRLTDASGQPINGTFQMVFTRYHDPSGMVWSWTETHPAVQVTDGLFSVLLGSVTPFPASGFTGMTYYLGITVDGTPSGELVPLVSTPYAYHSRKADTAGYALEAPGDGSGGWVDDGAVVRLGTATDKVGVGTSDPEYTLDVHSTGAAIRGYTTGGPGTAGVYGHATDVGSGVMGTSTNASGVYGASTNGFGGFFVGPKNYFEGRVGIGQDAPTHALTVNGAIGIQEAAATKYHVDYHAGGLDFIESGVAYDRLFLQDGGKVGIGTGSPQQKLHVAGNLKVNDTLTAGAIFATSIVDEPGLVSAAQTGGDAGESYDSLFSGQIEVPGPGHIWIMATAHATLDHPTSGSDAFAYGVSTSRTSLPSGRWNGVFFGSSADAGLYGLPVACHTLFTVSSEGTYRFYFVCNVSESDHWTISDGRMIMMYFPTLYAAKGEAGPADADPETVLSPSASGSVNASVDAESSRVAELESRLSALTERLEALEQQAER